MLDRRALGAVVQRIVDAGRVEREVLADAAVVDRDAGVLADEVLLVLGDVDVAEDFEVVFAVVTLRDRPEDSTLNLLGPIVVNRVSHEAAQVVLPSSGEAITATIPNAELSRYEGVGHSPFLEASERFNAELAAFVARL